MGIQRIEKEDDLETCSSCGATTANGEAGCQALFERLLARDFGDPLFFGTHRLAVDTYSLQHPDRYCASAKSFAAHLVSLYLILERGGNAAVGDASVHRWLDGALPLRKPELPRFRGNGTVADVAGLDDPSEYQAAVRRWARSTWSAYNSLHARARTWSQEAVASRSSRKPK